MQPARGHLARAGTTPLDVSGLIHDACLRLERSYSLPHRNRCVFLACASKVMRSVSHDCACDGVRLKRGDCRKNEVADALEASLPTIKRDWRRACVSATKLPGR